jgi:hypothetical protein
METIDLRPRPSMLLESLRSMGYTVETALAANPLLELD